MDIAVSDRERKQAPRMLYRWVYGPNGETLREVGIYPDGSLHNPNGYPDDLVRSAVLAANARRHARRSAAALKAAETRRQRRSKRVYTVAQKIVAGAGIGPRSNCVVCGRGLGDQESVARGIGSECWQDVLASIAAHSPSTSGVTGAAP